MSLIPICLVLAHEPDPRHADLLVDPILLDDGRVLVLGTTPRSQRCSPPGVDPPSSWKRHCMQRRHSLVGTDSVEPRAARGRRGEGEAASALQARNIAGRPLLARSDPPKRFSLALRSLQPRGTPLNAAALASAHCCVARPKRGAEWRESQRPGSSARAATARRGPSTPRERAPRPPLPRGVARPSPHASRGRPRRRRTAPSAAPRRGSASRASRRARRPPPARRSHAGRPRARRQPGGGPRRRGRPHLHRREPDRKGTA